MTTQATQPQSKPDAKSEPEEKPKGRLKDLAARAADKVRGGPARCACSGCC